MSLALIPPPAAGFYPGMPASQYHALDALNAGKLNQLYSGDSPAMLQDSIVNGSEQTDALKLGSAIHAAVLQPNLFESDYAVAGPCSGTTQKGTGCTRGGAVLRGRKWFCGQHDPDKESPIQTDRIVISQADYDLCRWIRDGVEQHPLTRGLLQTPAAQIELTAIATDDTGLVRKSRNDIYRPDLKTIFDLKSADDDSENGWYWSCRNYGYFRSADHYLTNDRLLGGGCENFTHIIVRKSRPFIPVIRRVPDELIAEAHQELIPIYELYRRCRETGRWPHHGWQWAEGSGGGEYVVTETRRAA